jgi:hypothetical protein
MQPYIYEPLPTARSVRLLKLHGDSEPPIRDDRIRCSLRVVSLDECPTYSAISYTWGDALVTHVIECDVMERRSTRGLTYIAYCKRFVAASTETMNSGLTPFASILIDPGSNTTET